MNYEFEKHSNIVPGIIGAILGSLVGSITWVLIHQQGYMSGISGLVMTVCSLYGYGKLSGRLDKKGVIITFLILLFMVYISNRLSYAVELYNIFKNVSDLTLFDSFQIMPSLMKYEDIKRGYLTDLALGYVFCIIISLGRFIGIFLGFNKD